jgi:hypothetical protein
VRVVNVQAVEVCGAVVVAGHNLTEDGTKVIDGSEVESPTSRSVVCATPLLPVVVSGSAVGGAGGETVGV